MNTVELLDFIGSDETHALSAWTSTSRELTDERRQRIGPMLSQLAKNRHHTPFEKSYLHFLVRCEVASHIQMLKHRIGVSINAESARYRELKHGEYHTPPDWSLELIHELDKHYDNCEALYHHFIRQLEPLLGRKRAKESARFVLPYGHVLTSDVAFNFRSFVHFLQLRDAPDAQLEIHNIASQMIELVRETGAFNLSLQAFDL